MPWNYKCVLVNHTAKRLPGFSVLGYVLYIPLLASTSTSLNFWRYWITGDRPLWCRDNVHSTTVAPFRMPAIGLLGFVCESLMGQMFWRISWATIHYSSGALPPLFSFAHYASADLVRKVRLLIIKLHYFFALCHSTHWWRQRKRNHTAFSLSAEYSSVWTNKGVILGAHKEDRRIGEYKALLRSIK